MGYPARQTAIEGMAVMLPYGGTVEVVGESHYKPELFKLAGRRRRDAADIPIVAVLVREPDNRYDSNAVKVVVNGYHVGYLGRADAAAYAPLLDRLLATDGVHGACPGRIIGGWLRTWDEAVRGIGDRATTFVNHTSEGDYGVRLALAPPHEVRSYLDRSSPRRLVFDPSTVPLPER